MKHALIRWLLKLLGHPVPVLPEFQIFALVSDGERLAEVTTNQNRARAIQLQSCANGITLRVFRCVPVEEAFKPPLTPGFTTHNREKRWP